MHCSGFTSTMPFAYWTIAPGAGQASRHPGSAQCMHWSLRMSHMSPPSTSCSSKRMRFQKDASSVGIVWYVPRCSVPTTFRSFHSWHATSHALQPMQVDVSMYLETVGRERRPVAFPDERMPEAEDREISRFCTLIVVLLSGLLELDEERLVLGRPGVRVHRRGRQEVGERTGMPGFALVAPVQREADLPDRLPVDLHRTQALGDHRHSFDGTPCRRDAGLPPVRDALLLGESLRDLDEEARLKLVQAIDVLGPVVVVLRQAVGHADDGELIAFAVDVLVGLEFLRGGIGRHLGVQRVVARGFDRLVMLGEGAVVQRCEELPDALG